MTDFSEVLWSPKGNLGARVKDPYSSEPTLEIIDIAGEALWKVPYEDFSHGTLPRPRLNVLRWSPDGEGLFFFYSFEPDGGDIAFYWTGNSLSRIFVVDGSIETILPRGNLITFALSPDAAELAYIRSREDPPTIRIRDVETGVERTATIAGVPGDRTLIGDLYWSPDGKRIAFQVQMPDYDIQTLVVDSATMQQKVIRRYKLWETWFEGWGAPSLLKFRIEDIVLFVDASTGEVLEATLATPAG